MIWRTWSWLVASCFPHSENSPESQEHRPFWKTPFQAVSSHFRKFEGAINNERSILINKEKAEDWTTCPKKVTKKWLEMTPGAWPKNGFSLANIRSFGGIFVGFFIESTSMVSSTPTKSQDTTLDPHTLVELHLCKQTTPCPTLSEPLGPKAHQLPSPDFRWFYRRKMTFWRQGAPEYGYFSTAQHVGQKIGARVPYALLKVPTEYTLLSLPSTRAGKTTRVTVDAKVRMGVGIKLPPERTAKNRL